MSVIMPVGKNSNDWSLESIKNGLTKTASTEQKSERDSLYDAAQKSIEANQKKKACMNTVADGLTTDKPVDPVAPAVEPVVDVKPEDVAKEVAPETVTEKIEKVEKAIDEVEVAIADVKDAVAPAADDKAPVDEVEIELDNKDEIPEEKKDAEIIVESKEEKPAEKPAEKKTEEKPEEKKEEEIKTRASANTWQKLSGVSKETRNKVYDYYVNCLGYPKDYVALLVKNYEK